MDKEEKRCQFVNKNGRIMDVLMDKEERRIQFVNKNG